MPPDPIGKIQETDVKVQRIGNTEIRKVDEISRMPLEARWLFPSIDEAFVEANRHWLGDNLVEPGSTRLYMSFHSYVIRTRHHTILVDACNGNHKQRPSMPAWNDLNTPYLANLAAIGVRPEEIDIVLCTHLHADHVGWNTRLESRLHRQAGKPALQQTRKSALRRAWSGPGPFASHIVRAGISLCR